ncbi:MAG: Rieske 2Fe-2S domain-containing protein [Anaerolineae bacterium]|nr:Rieske 2Fe-2S domain-containing protein [Anaerolineae bacterium]
MLKNFWWPLDFSEKVTAKPIRVTALMQEFVLYRLPDGRAQVLSDLCVHRGGALSDGWLEGNCIVCPYHGWHFEADGACVKIPANQPGVPVPKKARVDAYPTVENYGFVWAFLGDFDRATVRRSR